MSLLQEFEKERRARLARILAAAVPDHGIDLKRKPEPPPRPPPEPPRDWLYVGSGFEQRNRVHIIVSTVCVHFSISPNELKSACRIHPIVRARHVASFLLRELLALSLPKIGTILGGRDHTTILNGYNRIRDRINSPDGDPDVIELIDRVRGLPDMTDLMKNYDLWKCRSPDDDRPPDEFDDQPEEEEEMTKALAKGEARDSTALPSDEEIAKTFYLGMYEREDASWNANESKDVWVSGARAVLALLNKTGAAK